MTIERQVTIINKLGLHLRAAGKIVDVASRFAADIRIRKGEKEADGKSIIGVMTLAAPKGTQIVLLAKGQDAADAVDSLEDLVRNKFGEEE